MIKIDSIKAISTTDGNILVQYSPSLYNDKDIRVRAAILKLKCDDIIGDKKFEHKVIIKNRIVDTIIEPNNFICINISDELQDFISNDNNNDLNITIRGNSNNYVLLNKKESSVEIDYLIGNELLESNAYYENNIKRAGASKVNLSTGIMQFTHNDLNTKGDVLPVIVNHIFNYDKNIQDNNILINSKYIKLPKYYCGNGWKTSMHQYLFQQNFESLLNGEISKEFTYIDGAGNRQLFHEKYYYINSDNEKKYLSVKDIEIDLEHKLSYTNDSIKYNVEKEITTTNGLYIQSDLEGFQGLSLLQKDIDEVATLKQRIKDINKSIADIDKQITNNWMNISFSVLSKKISSINNDIESNSYAMASAQSDTKNNFTKKQYIVQKLGILVDPNCEEVNINDQLLEDLYNISKESKLPIDDTSKTTDTSNTTDKNNKYKQYILNLQRDIIDETFRCNKKELPEQIEKEKTPIHFEDAIIALRKTLNEKIESNDIEQIVKDMLNDVSFEDTKDKPTSIGVELEKYRVAVNEKITEILNKYTGTDISLLFTNQIRSDYDIYILHEQINSLISSKKELNDELIKSERQLAYVQNQIPVHYIVDNDGNRLGFGRTKEKDVYRLIAIIDRWENGIIIKYNDNDSIDRIIDANNKEIEFIYKNDILTTIIDNKRRELSFKYDDRSNLIEIKYADGTLSTYQYDDKNKLIAVIDASGYGVEYEYDENSKVVKVNELAKFSIISKNGAKDIEKQNARLINGISYAKKDELAFKYNNKSTIIEDKYCKKINYTFDIMGRPINIYENEFDINNYNMMYVSAFNYNDGKNAFSISSLPNSQNYLLGSSYKDETGNIVSQYKVDSEIYLGSDFDCNPFICEKNIVVEDGQSNDTSVPSPTILKIEKNNTKAIGYFYKEISELELNKIKNGNNHKFILSCWAKADSACIGMRSTDMCGLCDNNEHYNAIIKEYNQYATENQKERRFGLRIEIDYTDGRCVEQFGSFNWTYTDWQYCAIPVFVDEDLQKIKGIKVYFDYSCNTNSAEIFGMELREGKWQYQEFDENNQVVYAERSNAKYISLYEYNDKKLVKEILIDRENYNKKKQNKEFVEYPTTYTYDGNGALIRVVDYNGLVSEKVYNDKGVLVKTIAFNKKAPSNKVIEEIEYDKNGKQIVKKNEFGDKLLECEYLDNTGLISVEKGVKGASVAYGYDFSNDTLLSISSDSNGESNQNIYGYTLGLLTSLCHNDTNINYEYDGFGRKTKIGIGDQNYVNIEYSENTENTENVANIGVAEKEIKVCKTTTSKYANGVTFEKEVDAKGNVVATKYNGETYTKNFYDTYGRLNAVEDYANGEKVSCKITRDNQDNILKVEYAGSKKDYSLSNEYDQYGLKTKATIDINGIASTSTTFEYDNTPSNKVKQVHHSCGINQAIKYDELGRLQKLSMTKKLNSIDLRIDKSVNYEQKGDHTSSLIANEIFSVNGAKKDYISYDYDVNGNIIRIKNRDKLEVRYLYDSLNRLIREDNKKLNKTFIYTYDNAGNILTKIEYSYTIENIENVAYIKEIKYDYASDGWQDMLLGVGGLKCGDYDALGNPRLYRGKKIEWSHGRQLDKIGDIEYKYNAQGIRIEKIVNGLSKKYYVDDSTILAEETNGNTIIYTYGVDGILGFNYNTRDYYYKKNVQGDVLAILDENGEEIVQYVYDAWGNHKVLVLDNGTYKNITESTASEYNNIAVINPIRYHGYYYDNETGLYYLNSRYYDPEIGRFINADDISYVAPDRLNGLNLYAYCGNNPVMNVDPDGTLFWFFITAIIAGALIGGVKNGVQAYQEGQRGTGLAGAVLGGMVEGAAMGGLMGLGGALGAGAVSVTLGQAFVLSAGIGAGAGMLSYTLESTLRTDREWSVGGMMQSGISGLINGSFNVAIGKFGANIGVYDNLAISNVYGKNKLTQALVKPLWEATHTNIGRAIFSKASFIIGEWGATKIFLDFPADLVDLLLNRIFIL